MKSKNRRILPVLLLILSLKVFGQSDYYEGFIIQNNSDTTYGSIHLKSIVKSQQNVTFKNKNGEVTEFAPGDIFGYYVSDRKFYVTETIALGGTEKEVFLEFLVDGIVDLYFYSEKNMDYYFLKKDGKMYLLSNSETEFSVGNGKYVRDKEEYKATLTSLMQDAPDMKSKIERAYFSPKALSNISMQYHKKTCDDYKCINYRKTEKNQLSIQPAVSFVSSNMTLASSDQNARNTTIQGGLNLQITSKRNYKWKGVFGIHYSTEEFNGTFTNSILGQRTEHRVSASYSLLRIPIGIEYHLKALESSPFFGVSLNNIFLSNSEYEINQKDFFGNFSTPVSSETRNRNFGIMGEVGYKHVTRLGQYYFLKISAEYRPATFFPVSFLDRKRVVSIFATFGYSFKIRS